MENGRVLPVHAPRPSIADSSDSSDAELITSEETTRNTYGSINESKSTAVPSGSVYALPPGHVPAYRAVFLISNAALGAGLLNFPEAYMKAGGYKTAISIQLVRIHLFILSFHAHVNLL